VRKYVRENVAESCMTCHDLTIMVGSRRIDNIQQQLHEAPFIHEVMKGESCPICHTPHGSEQSSLLQEGYPAGSYQSYNSENYRLCWQCHDPALVEKVRNDVTEFRNGDVNLHRLHVVQLRRGRACHLCHEPHTSNKPHLIRERILFGEWDTVLGYEPLPEGGRCQSPCHRVMEYRR